MVDPARSLSVRMIAGAAFLFFFPIVISIIVYPAAAWGRNYPGILFHLAIFLLVAKLEAPEWARAAGYGWLVLDVTAGVMTLNGVPHEIYDYVRLGGHIFAGIWFVTASLSGSWPVKVTGVIVGVWLASFSFVSPFFPLTVLGPTSILVLAWLLIIAWQNGSKARPRVASPPLEAAIQGKGYG